MKVEDHRLVHSKQRVELLVAHPMWMLRLRHQPKQIDHVNKPDLQLRAPLAQNRHRGQRFRSRNIARTRHHHIRVCTIVVRSEIPDADSLGAMVDRLLHRQVLQMRRLVRHNHVHIIRRAQAVVRHRQQTIRIRRQIVPRHLGALVRDDVQKSRVLVCKSPSLWSCRQTSEVMQQVQRRNPARASAVPASTSPATFACWLNIQVDDVHERFVARKRIHADPSTGNLRASLPAWCSLSISITRPDRDRESRQSASLPASVPPSRSLG